MGKIKVKLAGMVNLKMINQVYEEEVDGGIKLADLFKRIDKKGGWGNNYFKKILKLPTPPVLLVNGEPVELEEIKNYVVNAGDEVALLMPMAGG